MSDSFNDEDFSLDDDLSFEDDFDLEEEWVELSDIKGQKAAFRHLATIRFEDKVYSVLSAHRSDNEIALMIVREDQTADGAQEHSIVGDEQEIDRVIGKFLAQVISRHLSEEMDVGGDFSDPCGYCHLPGEFCCCDDPAYLQ